MSSPVTTRTRTGTAGTGLLSDHVNRINRATGSVPNQEDYPAVKDIPWAEELNQSYRICVGGLETSEPHDLWIDGKNVISHARNAYFPALELETDTASATQLVINSMHDAGTPYLMYLRSASTGGWFLYCGQSDFRDPEVLTQVAGIDGNGNIVGASVGVTSATGIAALTPDGIDLNDIASNASGEFHRHAMDSLDLSGSLQSAALVIPSGVGAGLVKVVGMIDTIITGTGGLTGVDIGVLDGSGDEWASGLALAAFTEIYPGAGSGDGGRDYPAGMKFVVRPIPDTATITGGTLRLVAFWRQYRAPGRV